jgi:hypothetical protein
MNDAYVQGFLQKCAEEGVAPQALLKAAQVWDPQTLQAARNREQAAASQAMTNAPPSEGATGRSVRRPGQRLWTPGQQAATEQATSAQAVARAPAAGGATGYMSGVTGRSVGYKPTSRTAPVQPPAVARPAAPAVAQKAVAQPPASNIPEPTSTREVAARRQKMNVYPAQGAAQPAAAPIYSPVSAGKPMAAPATAKLTPAAAPTAPAVPAWATASPANRAMWATRGKPAGQQAAAFRSTLAGAQGLSANQQRIAGQQGGQVTPYGAMSVGRRPAQNVARRPPAPVPVSQPPTYQV